MGTAVREGAALAVAEQNQVGGVIGKKLRLVVEDNGGEPKQAISSLKIFSERYKADYILAPFTHIVQAIAPEIAARKKFLLYWAGLSTPTQQSPHIFKDFQDTAEDGRVLADEIVRRKPESIAILTEVQDACLEIVGHVRNRLRSAGISIIAEDSFNPGDTDFRSVLLRLHTRKPKAFVFCTWRDGALVMRQFDDLGLTKIPTYQVLAPFFPYNDTTEARSSYERNGTISTWVGPTPDELADKDLPFAKKFKFDPNNRLRLETLVAYDGVRALIAAMSICHDANDIPCVAKRFQHTTYDGVAGPLRFNDLRRSIRPSRLMRVVNGRWEFLH